MHMASSVRRANDRAATILTLGIVYSDCPKNDRKWDSHAIELLDFPRKALPPEALGAEHRYPSR